MNPANRRTIKLFTVSITAMIILSATMIVTAFLSSNNISVQKAGAQMMGPGMMGSSKAPMSMRNQNFTGMMGPGMMMAAPNITGSVPIFSKAIASQAHTSLVNATMTAEKTVGSNAHAISTQLGIENGFLVYTAWVIDSGNSVHRVIVDAGNGKVLSNQQISMRETMMMHMMMHPDMMMGPQSGMGMMMGPSHDMMTNRDMMMGRQGMGEMMQNGMMGSEDNGE